MPPGVGPRRIIACDLDGTLLKPDQRIGLHTRDVLRRVHQQGEHVVFATGRHHIDVTRLREQAGVPALLVTSNGARVHGRDGEELYAVDVAEDAVLEVYEAAKDDETVTCHIFRDDGWWLNRETEALEKFLAASPFRYTLFDPASPPVAGVAKVMLMRRDHDHLVQYKERLSRLFGDSLTILFSTPFCLEVMAKGVSKSAALARVAEAHGLDLSHCIAFGDGMNDVDMLRDVGRGLIMRNGHDAVKAALPHLEVIGGNDEEGVARYLEEHVLLA